MGTPERGSLLRGFRVFAGVFEGGFENKTQKWMVFGGEFVVKVW
jgi:hypothetical protein